MGYIWYAIGKSMFFCKVDVIYNDGINIRSDFNIIYIENNVFNFSLWVANSFEYNFHHIPVLWRLGGKGTRVDVRRARLLALFAKWLKKKKFRRHGALNALSNDSIYCACAKKKDKKMQMTYLSFSSRERCSSSFRRENPVRSLSALSEARVSHVWDEYTKSLSDVSRDDVYKITPNGQKIFHTCWVGLTNRQSRLF